MPCCYIHDDVVQAADLLVVHHMHPTAFGGPDIPENRCFLCASCHDVLHKAEPKVSRGKSGYAIDMLDRFLPNQPARRARLWQLIQAAAAARQQQSRDTSIPEAGEPTETVLLSLEVPRWLHHLLKQLALESNSGLYRYCARVLEQHVTDALQGKPSIAPSASSVPTPPPLLRLR